MASLDKEQYKTLCDRRLQQNSMMWETPVLSLTAQAFLFTIALGGETSQVSRIISGILSFVAAVSSLQLMMKHRYLEQRDSKLLQSFEEANNHFPIHAKPPKRVDGNRFTREFTDYSSYNLWLWTLGLFGGAAFCVIVIACLCPEILGKPSAEMHGKPSAEIREKSNK